jgi:hypothetical protein
VVKLHAHIDPCGALYRCVFVSLPKGYIRQVYLEKGIYPGLNILKNPKAGAVSLINPCSSKPLPAKSLY